MNDVFQYIDQHADLYVERLRLLCQQPSVAAQGYGVAECAEMVKTMLDGLGAATQLLPTGGPPVVYGELAGRGDRTLSFYDHYDVQPPEPLELWDSEPLGAAVRDGRIYARGVADNKGDLVARLCAVEAYQAVRGPLPVRLKFIVEGEEEVGSPHLEAFADAHPDLIAADANIWEGSLIDLNGRVEAWLGVKGMAYVELSVTCAKSDLHSMMATIVPNAVWRLAWALNTLKGPDERIRVPGFYDAVRPPTEQERQALAEVNFNAEAHRELFGLDQFLLGLEGLSLLEKHIFQPTMNIAGIWGGYTGPGLKTVLPNAAACKIDMRLVPDQVPEEVVAAIRRHLDRQGFGDVQVKLLAAERSARTPLDAPIVETVHRAVERVYGHPPVLYPMVPGTGPMYPLCQKHNIPSVSVGGVITTDCNVHAPNENVAIVNYLNGIKLAAQIVEEFGAAP